MLKKDYSMVLSFVHQTQCFHFMLARKKTKGWTWIRESNNLKLIYISYCRLKFLTCTLVTPQLRKSGATRPTTYKSLAVILRLAYKRLNLCSGDDLNVRYHILWYHSQLTNLGNVYGYTITALHWLIVLDRPHSSHWGCESYSVFYGSLEHMRWCNRNDGCRTRFLCSGTFNSLAQCSTRSPDDCLALAHSPFRPLWERENLTTQIEDLRRCYILCTCTVGNHNRVFPLSAFWWPAHWTTRMYQLLVVIVRQQDIRTAIAVLCENDTSDNLFENIQPLSINSTKMCCFAFRLRANTTGEKNNMLPSHLFFRLDIRCGNRFRSLPCV